MAKSTNTPAPKRRTTYLAKLLRESRAKLGDRNASKVARAAGTTPQRLWNIEHGRALPPLGLVRKLAKAAGAEPNAAIVAWAMDKHTITLRRSPNVLNSAAALGALAEWWPTANGAGLAALVDFLRRRS